MLTVEDQAAIRCNADVARAERGQAVRVLSTSVSISGEDGRRGSADPSIAGVAGDAVEASQAVLAAGHQAAIRCNADVARAERGQAIRVLSASVSISGEDGRRGSADPSIAGVAGDAVEDRQAVLAARH